MRAAAGPLCVIIGGIAIGFAVLFSLLPLFSLAFFGLLGYSWQEIVRSNPELKDMVSNCWLSLAIGAPTFVVGLLLIRKPRPGDERLQGRK